MIFSAIAGAVVEKIAPPSFEVILADKEKAEAAVKQSEAQDLAALAEKTSEARSTARTELANIAKEHEALISKRSRGVAHTYRATLVATFKAWRAEPTRAGALKVKEPIVALHKATHELLGTVADHHFLITAMIESFEDPTIIPLFTSPDALHGGPVEAANRLYDACLNGVVTELTSAIEALEASIEQKIKFGSLSKCEPSEQHLAIWGALTTHAVASLRADETQSLTGRFAGERASEIAAAYRAPVSVDSDGGVDANGRQYAQSVVRYEAATPVVAEDDEQGHSVVERGKPVAKFEFADAPNTSHFDRLAE